jgi:hypothetical protein
LSDFVQNRVVLLTAKTEAHTKLLRQPRLRDAFSVEFAVQKEVERAIVPSDDFENRVRDAV